MSGRPALNGIHCRSNEWNRFCSSVPHQHVLELDVTVQQPLGVQEADALDHVQRNLHPSAKVQADLERSVQVTRVPWGREAVGERARGGGGIRTRPQGRRERKKGWKRGSREGWNGRLDMTIGGREGEGREGG